MLFDKTGTLTQGRPVLADVVTAGEGVDPDELLEAGRVPRPGVPARAGELDRHRGRAPRADPGDARRRGRGARLRPARTRSATHEVRLGKASWIVPGPAQPWVRQLRRRASLDGSLTVFVAVDGEPAGAFLLEDLIRPDAPRMVRGLRDAGIQRVVLVTGDRADIAETVGRIVGHGLGAGRLRPRRQARPRSGPRARQAATIMVGDGVNDAPALAAAERRRGARIARRDGVLGSGRRRPDRRPRRCARRRHPHRPAFAAHRACRRSLVGMGLSLVAMAAAAVGLLPPAAGAVLQEAIDVLAIGLALRAVLPGRGAQPSRWRRPTSRSLGS